MTEEFLTFWENAPFPSNQGKLIMDGRQTPKFTMCSLEKLPDISNYPLRGFTREGRYITVFKSQMFGPGYHRFNHSYDIANMRYIESADDDAKIIYTYDYYLTKCYIGDYYVTDENPKIDAIEITSKDLASLSFTIELSSDYEQALLFQNDFVEIFFYRDYSSTQDINGENKNYFYRLRFDFKESERLDFAVRYWLYPIVELLSIICGGKIAIDKHRFISKV